MFFKNISLRNFKCFEEVNIPLSKLTILTGPNSSGKSSFLYGLLGTLQSESFPFYFSPNGKYVNMGSYSEMVFKNNKNRKIGIDLKIEDAINKEDKSIFSEWIPEKPGFMPKLSYLNISTSAAKAEISLTKNDTYVLSMDYQPEKYFKDKGSLEFIQTLQDAVRKIMSPQKTNQKPFTIDILEPCKIRRRSFNSLENMIIKLKEFRQLLSFLDFMRTHSNFISSFRLLPDRTYYQVSQLEKKIGKYGENYIDQIFEWEKLKNEKFNLLQSNLREFKLLFSLKSKKLTGGRVELSAKVKSGGIWASLTDVGFGISQFLPVLVADLQLPSFSTLYVAQPEIHLHPNSQAFLGNYFVKQIKSNKKRYVIETHSEYFLNRLRLAITKNEIKSSDISVFYFENNREGTKAFNIQFLENGQIKNAPKSFFDTYMIDVMDIALNA